MSRLTGAKFRQRLAAHKHRQENATKEPELPSPRRCFRHRSCMDRKLDSRLPAHFQEERRLPELWLPCNKFLVRELVLVLIVIQIGWPRDRLRVLTPRAELNRLVVEQLFEFRANFGLKF